MKRRVLGAVLVALALVVVVLGRSGGTNRRDAEVTVGKPWTGSGGVTESVAKIAARPVKEQELAAEPDQQSAGEASAEAVDQNIREKPEPGEGGFPPRKAAAPAPQQRVGRAAVAPSSSFSAGTSFLGVQSSESGFIPPDSMGSVGPTQIVVGVNGRIKVFDKSGNLATCPAPSANPCLNVSDSTFWSSVDNGSDPTDPGVEYDRLSGRWILTAVNTASSNNRVMIAVSDGPTITSQSSFTFFQFSQNAPPPAGDGGLFADYPQMGVDADAIYIGVNEFSGNNFAHTTAFVINKDQLINSNNLVVTAFRNLTSGSTGQGPDSPQPAQDMDPNVGEGYIVGPDNQLANRLDVLRISNPGALPPSAPSISGNLMVTIPSTARPLNVPAQGSNKSLDALDDRLFEAMVGRAPDGTVSLWTAHNIRVNSSGVGTSSGDRDGARWYQLGTLSTTPSLVQSGTLFDTAASSPRFFWIPSIAMNGQGHASLNSSTAGSGRFAEAASSGRLATDPTGTTEPFDLTQSSSSSYNLGSGNPQRWGDYSQTVVDPTDNMTFWTFQEYANATNSWGVRVIKLKPPPPATSSAASPNTIQTTDSNVTVQVTGTPMSGSGFFDPGPDSGGPGWPNHITASVSGGVVVNSVDYVSPTQVTLHLDATGVTTEGSKDVTITNPDGQSVTGPNILVVGQDHTPPDPPSVQGTVPTSPANDNAPTIFGAAEGGSTVKLYPTPDCTGTPVSGSQLAFASPGISVSVPEDSTTTFSATATDVAGNESLCSNTLSSDGTITYVNDSTSPQVVVTGGPGGRTTNRTPTFTYSATDAVGPVTIRCSIDTGTPTFSACSGPGNSDTPATPLFDGPHTFRVQATDAAGNTSLATRAFTIEPPPPETTITKGPKKTHKRRPKFKFTSSQAGSTFQCRLDAGAFAPCSSPFVPRFKLKRGKHVLRVIATGPSGASDSSPAVRKFKVIA